MTSWFSHKQRNLWKPHPSQQVFLPTSIMKESPGMLSEYLCFFPRSGRRQLTVRPPTLSKVTMERVQAEVTGGGGGGGDFWALVWCLLINSGLSWFPKVEPGKRKVVSHCRDFKWVIILVRALWRNRMGVMSICCKDFLGWLP